MTTPPSGRIERRMEKRFAQSPFNHIVSKGGRTRWPKQDTTTLSSDQAGRLGPRQPAIGQTESRCCCSKPADKSF
jgi:hypothetical protein